MNYPVAADFSPGGGFFVARLESSGDVDVWSIRSSRQVYGARAVKDLIWGPNDRKFACIGTSRTATIVSLQSTSKPLRIPCAGILDGDFTPDATRIAFATGEASVPLFSVEDGTRLSSLDFPSRINSLSFNPDGSSLVAYSSSGTVYERNLRDGQTREIMIGVKKKNRISFSPDGRWLALRTEAGDLQWHPMRITDLQALLKK
jgi:WD40 repeat protein